MSVLMYSAKCQHSNDLVKFVNNKPGLKQVVHLHNIDTHGIPPQYTKYIKRVPTIITNNRQIKVGSECKGWLESLLPPEEVNHCPIGGVGCGMSQLNGVDDSDDMFNLNNYGVSLQPEISMELQNKIDRKVE